MTETDRRVAVVTGGARGIGAAIAERLAEGGDRVVLWDYDEEAAEERVESLRESGHAADYERVDVSDPDAVERATESTVASFDRIDVLVNNAGIAGTSVPLWEQSVEDWQDVIDIDLTGVFLCCKYVVPVMRDHGWGRIVNIASIAGKEGNPLAAPYSTAKAGVIGLTKSLGKELADDDVLVNCVTPAVIETEILEQVSEEHLEYMLEKIPLDRPGQPEEVAAMVDWLCSAECSFSTGAVFDISGGRATY
ncbi:SDR family NAD(P)-dependent oxidoreductase [Halovenus marina]|uniref:SDR family NAD(P)-dependent oxidoreductase n=1 Tax=Halovenus marina TaxID=3396621 RepID=UPI003F57D14A